MSINRHNYEEYFILYMDNELSADQRRLVEEFVQIHPDLKEELDNLLQFKMIPDETIVFMAKEELLKGEENTSLAHFRETLLLYIDNELNPAQKESVKQLLSSNETLKNEFDSLMQAKLEPELIAFPDKSLLYRRTERRIPAVWWRMAAAVLILGLILSSVLLINRQPSATPPVAVIPSGNEKNEKSDKIKNNSVEVKEEVVNQPKEQLTVTNKQQPALVKNDVIEKKEIKIQEIKSPVEVAIPKVTETIADNNNLKPSNNLPQPQKDGLAINTKQENKDPNALTEAGVTNPVTNPLIIQTGSTDQGFAQDGKDGKKSKLRGFFRKIARTFEKRTNIDPTTDDNKLLVAGLSINLK